MRTLDKTGKGIVLITDKEQRLIGTVTDGDIRRAILDGIDLNEPIIILLKGKTDSDHRRPITARVGTKNSKLLALLKKEVLRQVPLLDEEEHVVDLVTINDLVPAKDLLIQAVVMAGGLGSRLRPLTKDLPKPMLPLGGRPAMELLLEQLNMAGIRRVSLATYYKSKKIREYFGDGKQFDIEIDYLNEEQPLGTAGALGLLERPKEPLLLINGDILTKMDFRALLTFHQKMKADVTVAVRQYDVKVPYGVLECNGSNVCSVREKPELKFFVNAGIYLIDPFIHNYIPKGKALDMTELIELVISNGHSVVSFPVVEYWLDIGKHEDYKQAQEDVENGRF